jgi:hypothetical protein
VQGISVSSYEIYLDGAASPLVVLKSTTNMWTMTSAKGLKTNSTHAFQIDYVTTGGQRSTISPFAYGTTWSGLNWGGIPYEWMAAYFGGYSAGKYNTSFWPAATAQMGATMNLGQIFTTGGNPLDSSTWLATQLTPTSQGLFLSWNTQPGLTYQVQVSTNFMTWSNVGLPRFAAGTSDSINVGSGSVGYYRLVFLR